MSEKRDPRNAPEIGDVLMEDDGSYCTCVSLENGIVRAVMQDGRYVKWNLPDWAAGSTTQWFTEAQWKAIQNHVNASR